MYSGVHSLLVIRYSPGLCSTPTSNSLQASQSKLAFVCGVRVEQDSSTPPISTGFQDTEYSAESLPFTRRGSKHKFYISVEKQREQLIHIQSQGSSHTCEGLGKVTFQLNTLNSHLCFHMQATEFILSFFKH